MSLLEEIEEIENEPSGSDTSGSVGSDNGSATGSGTNGSDRRTDGSGRNVDGNDREFFVAGRSNTDNGSASVEPIANDTNANVGNVDGNKNDADTRSSRYERERSRRPIRLGATDRNRDSDTGSATNARTGETFDNENDSEPVIRLGARTQGAPRSVKAKAETKSKLSEVKDLIRMFVDSLFEIPAIALKQDFWRLSKEESKTLSDAIIQWLESMPSADQSKISEFVGKHVPLINLCMVGFFIISERVRASVAVYQVTKAGNRFAQTVSGNVAPAENSPNVRTAMDDMFS